jgi:tetratricopeptide (TPR) repeat protein/capsular polysaccharide biosynthesis protein
LTQGKLSQAVLTCQKILGQNPNCAEAYQILGQAFYAGGNLQKARSAYTKAIEIQPNLAEARAYLGQLYKDVHWWDEAAFQYEKAIQLGLNWPELYGHLGSIFSNKGDLKKAKNYYEKAISLDSNYPNAYFNLALVQHQIGELELAINTYKKLLKLQPDNAIAYNNIGCVLAQLERNEEAIEVYKKGLEIKPDWARLHLNLGEVLVKKGKREEAIACFRIALKLEPNLAAASYDLGKALQSMGEHQLAIDYFEKAREIEPNDILTLSDFGLSLMAVGRLKEAIACWQKTIIDNQFISYYCQASVMEKEQASAAEKEQASAGEKEQASAGEKEQARCLFYDELDLAKLACANFIKSLLQCDFKKNDKKLEETFNYWAETYLRFANVFMEYGDYENAQSYYQKVLQIQPHNFDVSWRLGNSLVKQQRYKAAILAYQITLTILPDIYRESYAPTVYYSLGKALEKEENWERALEYYSKVLNRGNGQDARTTRIKDQRLYKTEKTQEKWNPQGLYLFVEDWIEAGNSKTDTLPVGYYLPVSFTAHTTPTAQGGGTVEQTSRLLSPIRVDSTPIVSKPGCYGLNCGDCLKRLYWWFEPSYEGEGLHKLKSGEDSGEDAETRRGGDTERKRHGEAETLREGVPASPRPRVPASPRPRVFSSLPTFVAKVPGGRAWIMPKKSYWMLCHAIAIITPDNYLLADISRDYPGQLPGCDKHDPSQHLAFSQEEWPPLEKIDGKAAILSVLSGNVYFHWMVDLLPRIEILRRGGIRLDQIDWFVVNNYQSRFQKETLTALGIPPEKILASDRHPHIQAEELIVPSFGSHLGWLQPWGLKFLREVFLTPKVLSKKGFPERIYISREKAKYRRVLNEGEVQEILSQYGFVTVSPESMSLEEQIAMFAAAKIIIAPHGSGLTNIIFCQAGTKVIELIAPHYLRYYYWGISKQLGLEHYFLSGEAFSCYPLRQLMYSSPLAEDILVNLKSLKSLMANC